ncbi:hypothetical protein CVT25_006664 [Psilocybe cyanescens]|uniref:Crinkler effector protein N-terminal domain-containing protein n=1 Tax=Psilocybe cyanescens TaxID=93625 RepID=A0A409XU30_PSICY|nr:hypothetical protein CVT25_006664 [Psilocybe cyanescens]
MSLKKAVQAVAALDPTQYLELNCFVLGDDHKKIPKTAKAGTLNDLIKEKRAPHLNHVDASDLLLWCVSFPLDDLEATKLENINLDDYSFHQSQTMLAPIP